VTAAEFEEQYARRSGTTAAELHSLGRWPQPCHCGWPECQGWEMGHQWEDAIVEDHLRFMFEYGCREPGDHGKTRTAVNP
jgi:hypothetical protein